MKSAGQPQARSEADLINGVYAAALAVGEELELLPTLQRVVDEARHLVDARFGALGVWNSNELTAFLYSGLSAEEAGQIAAWPRGAGILGHLTSLDGPIRVSSLSDHPLATGFPAGHPSMERFLGCPIIVGGAVVGTLYIAEPNSRGSFSDDDEATLSLFAQAAGTAIKNAQRFDALARREALLEGLHSLTSAALSPAGAVDDSIVRAAARLWRAPAVELFEVSGNVAAEAGINGGLRLVARHGSASHSSDAHGQPIPITAPHGSWVLHVHDPGSNPSAGEVAQFCAHAAVVLDFVAHDRTLASSVLAAERERLAADLHDRVIQRVFAVGLDLQRVAAGPVGTEIAYTLSTNVDALDEVTKDLRHAIYELQHGTFCALVPALHRQISDSEVPELLQVEAHIEPADDLQVRTDIADALTLVVREALANVVRHAATHTAVVRLSHDDDAITLTITDEGRGIRPEATRQSGISNMRRRVARAGGWLTITPHEPHGTTVAVVIPSKDQVPNAH